MDGPVLLVAVVWGSSYLATKQITGAGNVLAVLLLRFAVALPPLAFAARRALRRTRPAERAGGAALGLLLAVIFLLETFGVVHTSATNAGLIISLTMVLTPLAESALDRRRPAGTVVAAAALSVLGVALLTQGAGFTAPSAGDLLMLLAAAVRTAHVLVMHRLRAVRGSDDAALTFAQLGTAVLVFAALVPWTGAGVAATARGLGAGGWAVLLYLSLGSTLFAFLVQMWAVRRTSPSRVSLLLGTEPLWAAVAGVALGGDRLGAAGYGGALLVLAGTFWGRRAASPPADPPEPADPPAPGGSAVHVQGDDVAAQPQAAVVADAPDH
ncbi:DMT family transporter [Actinomadura parmotrematis]|uniref:DMT family transporter n=1 Tax=Actinomadura parmotrematis TaxID=2864039 RepID=A0ABS7FQW1_9ACTN|nr:DMT family transporter [Actinomadura parmotrematis]MBW8481928.1 DMT family transporter [Actinomadura parmotrematis]